MAAFDDDHVEGAPIWPVFGDLMSGLLGVFVLLLVWTLGFQLELAKTLEEEIRKREAAEESQKAFEQALAGPLASGRITFKDGKIGISGSVLFDLNSAALQPQGRELLDSLAAPLQVYLEQHDQVLMVSGFTDDLPMQKAWSRYEDNWELSAQRALNVTRALIEAGFPPERIFAAAFGSQQPVVPNTDDTSRSRNRRVEMSPVPRTTH